LVDRLRHPVPPPPALAGHAQNPLLQKLVALNASSSELPRIFERGEVAIIVDDHRSVIGILTKMDLIEMLARKTQIG
jgi:CBS-domain-containing membrane protein